MILIRKAAIAATVLLFIFGTGCGDTFRPIVLPVIQPGGDPQSNRNAIVLSNAGPTAVGTTTHINVAGDTNVGQVSLGANPVYEALIGGTVVVANAGESSLSAYTALLANGAQPITITLPSGSAPNYVFASNASTLFVSLPPLNSVGLVSLGSNIFVGSIAVGANPIAITGTPDGAKVYVANQGDGTVSVIATATNTVTSTIPVGTSPSAMTITADGKTVYVANQGSGTVSAIATATDTATSFAVGTSPSSLTFDPNLLRVYVANTGSNTVSVINADALSAGFNTVANVAVGASPKAVAPLADGSRAYVANSASATVSVINTLNNTVIRTITVGTTPISIVASPDSTKVFVANQGSNNVSVIQTSNDTVVATLPLPAGSAPVQVIMTP
jgi:YVTN family beta-propeller protein